MVATLSLTAALAEAEALVGTVHITGRDGRRRQWGSSTYDTERRAWWVPETTDYRRARSNRAVKVVAAAAEVLGVDVEEQYVILDCDTGREALAVLRRMLA